MGCVKSYFKQAQSAGVSPSSTTDSANKGADDSAVPSNNPSCVNVSSEKLPEEPESGDTSYGVEATAVRKLAASTGTVAILGTTAQTALKDQQAGENEDSESAKDTEDVTASLEDDKEHINDNQVEIEDTETVKEPLIDTENDQVATQSRIPLITETLVQSSETDPDEQSSDPTVDMNTPGDNQTITSEEVCDIQSVTTKPVIAIDEVKSDSNETTSAKTAHNDISSEQMKTNSLSDVSFSEFEDQATNSDHKEKFEEKPDAKELEDLNTDGSEGGPKEVAESDNNVQDPSEDPNNEQSDNHETLQSIRLEDDASNKNVDEETIAAVKIQSTFRGYLVRKTTEANQTLEDVEDKLTDSQIESVKEEVEEIIREAEETTESIRNTPDEGDIGTMEEFPDPPDDVTLDQLVNIKPNAHSNSPLPSAEQGSGLNAGLENYVSNQISEIEQSGDQKDQIITHTESTSSDSDKLTTDDDLPAPDTELLESSYTEDLNTEIMNSIKVQDEDRSDAADLTIDEDSELMKDLQKPQECDELERCDQTPAPDEDSAATLIQANVRGFLTRRQMDRTNIPDAAKAAAGELPPDEDTTLTSEEPTLEGNASMVVEAENNCVLPSSSTMQPSSDEMHMNGNISPRNPPAGSLTEENGVPLSPAPMQPLQAPVRMLFNPPNMPPSLAELASIALPPLNVSPTEDDADITSNSPANGGHSADKRNNGSSPKSNDNLRGGLKELSETNHSEDNLEATIDPMNLQPSGDIDQVCAISANDDSSEVMIPTNDSINCVEAEDKISRKSDGVVSEDIDNNTVIKNNMISSQDETASESTTAQQSEYRRSGLESESDTGENIPIINETGTKDNISDPSNVNTIESCLQDMDDSKEQQVRPSLPLSEEETLYTQIRQLKTPEVFVSQYEGEGSDNLGDISDIYDSQANGTSEESGIKTRPETESASEENISPSGDKQTEQILPSDKEVVEVKRNSANIAPRTEAESGEAVDDVLTNSSEHSTVVNVNTNPLQNVSTNVSPKNNDKQPDHSETHQNAHEGISHHDSTDKEPTTAENNTDSAEKKL